MNPLQAFFDAIISFLQALINLLAGFFDALISLLQAILGAFSSLL